MRIIFTFLFACLILGTTKAQLLGGSNTYDFLNLSESARVTGAAGSLITVKDDDAVLGFQAPSLLNESMHQQLSFNHAIYVSGINYGLANYAHHFNGINSTFNFGMQYTSYGKFERTDETGISLGNFNASEFAFIAGAGHQYSEHLSFGANIRLINSFLEDYSSIGMSADLAGTYADTAKQVVISLVFKNAGMQFSKYNPEEAREPLPFDVQFGISKRLKHIPFRFSVIAHKLHRWNLRYDDPNTVENNTLFVDQPLEEKKFPIIVDNFFRHFIFNGELLMGKKDNFRIRFGYNHLRHQEFAVKNLRSLSGVALGLGFKVSKFRLDYGRDFHHLSGGTNHISISTSIQEFKRN